MARQQSVSRVLVLFPMLFLMGRVDLEDPLILYGARVMFITVQVLNLLITLLVKSKVETRKDFRKIYVPAPSGPLETERSNKLIETTYYEHETSKVKEYLQQSVLGALISSFIHYKFDVNQVVVLQSVMVPLNMFENALIRAYIFGGGKERKWEEKLEGEDLDGADIQPSGEVQQQAAPTAKCDTAAPTELNTCIIEAWENGSVENLRALVPLCERDPDYQTTGDGWTALMVACGSSIDTSDLLETLRKAGADVCLKDQDGWTAMHWAAYHNRPEAAAALFDFPDAARCTALEAKDGRTPLKIAEEEGNWDVAAVLHDTKATTSDDTGKLGLRQRKLADDESTSISDVD